MAARPQPLLAAVGSHAPLQLEMGDHPLLSGFQVWHASAPQASGQFEIVGSDFSQIIEISVPPGETITAEPGTMLFMSPGMSMDADIGGLGQGLRRCFCAGESMIRLKLINNSQHAGKVALTPTFPAQIVPIDISLHDGMIFNRGAFLGAIGQDWKVRLKMVGDLGTCCCGGQGLFMNTLHGRNMVFLNAGGTVLTKILAEGEEIVVDKHAVLAFAETVKLEIRRTGGCCVCCFAGQGLFNAVLKGPGFVMLHSMALAKLRRAIGQFAPDGGAANAGANAGGSS